jgi:hypothetical protein
MAKFTPRSLLDSGARFTERVPPLKNPGGGKCQRLPDIDALVKDRFKKLRQRTHNLRIHDTQLVVANEFHSMLGATAAPLGTRLLFNSPIDSPQATSLRSRKTSFVRSWSHSGARRCSGNRSSHTRTQAKAAAPAMPRLLAACPGGAGQSPTTGQRGTRPTRRFTYGKGIPDIKYQFLIQPPKTLPHLPPGIIGSATTRLALTSEFTTLLGGALT